MPRQNTPPTENPQAVLQEIEQLGRNIAIARKRRGETQRQWAKKLGVSQPTMARIERGDPSVTMACYVMCTWLINQAEGLANLVAPLSDMRRWSARWRGWGPGAGGQERRCRHARRQGGALQARRSLRAWRRCFTSRARLHSNSIARCSRA